MCFHDKAVTWPGMVFWDGNAMFRVWAEFLAYDEAIAPGTLGLLRRFDVNLCLSVPYGHLGPALATLLRRYAEAGLAVTLWLLLPKSHGYWPSERNAALFAQYLDETLDWAEHERVPVPWIAVDLELPFEQAQGYLRARGPARVWKLVNLVWSNLNVQRFEQALQTYRAVLEAIHARGARALCAAHDYIATDFPSDHVVQDLLETPVTPVEWDVVSMMIYNSMVAGNSHGRISLADARWMEYQLARALVAQCGPRAGVSLGLTGVGVLGDEPHYTEPSELACDVAIAKAAGIGDIALYNLEGILHSADPAAWFQMAQDAPPQVPERTPWADRVERQRRRAMLVLRWLYNLSRNKSPRTMLMALAGL